jgi:hypothetical protein
MHSLNQQIGTDYRLFAKMIDYSTIVAHTHEGGGLLQFDIARQVFNQSKFSQARYFCSWFHILLLCECV